MQNVSLLQVIELRGPGRFWAAGFRTSVWCRVCSSTPTTPRLCSPAQTLSVEPFPHEPSASLAGADEHGRWRAGGSEWRSRLPASQHPAINHVPASLAYNETDTVSKISFSVLQSLWNSSELCFVFCFPYIWSDGLYGHFFRGWRIIDFWIYVHLLGSLWSLYHKVNTWAARMMLHSNRSGPVSDSLFWQKHKIQWLLLSSEAVGNSEGKKGMFEQEPSLSPNCFLSQVNCEKQGRLSQQT